MDSADPMVALHKTLRTAPGGVTVLLTDNSTVKGSLIAADEHCNIMLRTTSGNCRFIRGALIRVVHSN